MSSDLTETRVRRMNAGDLAQVMEIASSLNDSPRWPAWVYVEAVQAESSRRIVLVAETVGTGEVVGFTVAALVPPEAELETIGVAAKHQRRGIGRSLMGELIKELIRADVAAVLLEARASNVAAAGLYRAFRFRETGRRQRYYADPPEDAILMSLEIKKS